ncbi:hypothetical protein [Spirosoma validum]|uniref:Outer membrane protein beta-barrel domain-containing protein n=1 Tax=Spirosoma validum TaxID=2771355 RepID=A0A927GE01_9BACT|nr:hypothetical protein [Spirosoma validum]MBD2754327.1 hypothetical protein [Spirosoma validum]
MNRSSQTIFFALLVTGILQTQVYAQGRNQILFVGTPLAVGVGRYNAVGFQPSFDIRYQHPLGSNFTVTAKTGLDIFLVKSKYREYFRYYYNTTTGISIPITVGPRVYIVDGLYAGLNLGVDIGVNSIALTSFRFEPGFGYAIRLANKNYVDMGTSFITSFSEGSGAFSFNFAYGVNLGR